MILTKRSAFTLSALCWLATGCSSSSDKVRPEENPFQDAAKVPEPAEFARDQKRPLFRLAFASRVGGEVADCGCAVNPKGGADRRLNYMIEQSGVKDQGDLLTVDAGNALFPNARLDKGQAEDQKVRAAFILRTSSLMGVRVMNVGQLDLAAGTDFLKAHAKTNGMTLVSSNLVDEKGIPLFYPEARLALGADIKVAILGLSAGGQLPDDVKALDPAETFRKRLPTIPADHLIVVLSDLGRGADERLAKETTRPMVIIGARDVNSLDAPRHVGHSILVQPQIQGQQWGLLTVAWTPNAEGWFNPELGRRYSGDWERMRKDQELNASVSAELGAYSPEQINKKLVYSHKLVDMGVQYAGKNLLTNEVAVFKKASGKPASRKRGN